MEVPEEATEPARSASTPSLSRAVSSSAVVEVSKQSRTWMLGVAGGVLAFAGTAMSLATASMVSKKGGSVMVSAQSATMASIGWAAMLFNFVLLGGTTLISAAMGEGDALKAGRFARLTVAVATVAGVLGTAVLLPCRTHILDAFGQEEVKEAAEDLFIVLAAFFALDVVNKGLSGIMFGLMYIHILVGIACLGTGAVLGIAFPLFLATELGLQAFGIALGAGEVVVAVITLGFLLQRTQRERYGLGLWLSGISSGEVRAYMGSIGLLAYRSIIVETPYLITVLLAIRMSPEHGAVFQFLHLQTRLSENIVAGFAVAMNFMGARLWSAGYHGAFWNLLCFFLVCLATPIVFVFTGIAIAKGRGSLADDFAANDEKEDFDAILTGGTFAVYVMVVAARGLYSLVDQTLVGAQDLLRLSFILTISFMAFISVALAGYASDNFTVLYLGTLVFYICRIVGGFWAIRHLLRAHGMEMFVRGTRSDPEHALKLTINDPLVAKVFGGKVKESTTPVERAGETVGRPTEEAPPTPCINPPLPQ
mmetsp:Transcript_22503/g.70734  ORF Transcript_22503/g.70734 Transcript_22503/m.70734 type:complete len:536 (+) Transcript_22503:120-1727(+)